MTHRGAFFYASGENGGPFRPAAGDPSHRGLTPGRTPIRFRRTAGIVGTVLPVLVAGVGFILTVRYALWWFRPEHLPHNQFPLQPWMGAALNLLLFAALTGVEWGRVFTTAGVWLFSLFMRDPQPLPPPAGLRVAVLTCVVPSKEPLEVVEVTLKAMTRIRYQGTVHCWVLDEEGDPRVADLARRLGVRYFSRAGRPELNRPDGPLKARCKGGNLNAWRVHHEAEYDIVAQMDVDHRPTEDFLEKTLGYFQDPDVGFVVMPQVYGNPEAGPIARGASEQQGVFYGVVQRGANGLGCPFLIGSNHVYRPAALRAAGGYSGHIVEDHLTGLRIYGTRNPQTGRPWKGVYVPEVVSVGEGPSTWSAYLQQQMRWSYGLIDIIRRHSPRLLLRLKPLQALGYLLIQPFYWQVAFTFAVGNTLLAIYLLTGVSAASMELGEWLAVWAPQMAWSVLSYYLLQPLFVPRQRGAALAAVLLNLAAAPIYVSAAAAALAGRKLPYLVTPKGRAGTKESPGLFRWHLFWGLLTLACLAASFPLGHDAPQLRAWAAFNSAVMFGVTVYGLKPGLVKGIFQFLAPLRPAAAGAWALLGLALALTAGWGLVAGLRPVHFPGDPGPGQLPGPAGDGRMVAVSPGLGTGCFPGSRPAGRGLRFGLYRDPLFANRGYVGRLEAELGFPIDVVTVFQAWADRDSAFAGDWYWELAACGRWVVVSWEPWGRGRPGAESPSLKAIARGDYDGYVRSWARAVAATPDRGRQLVIRFAQEMDGDWYPWAGDPQAFKQAFRRIVAIFRSEGAEARFLFSPAWARPGVAAYYPGDDVVDFVGVTLLDFGPASPAGGQTFTELFEPQYPVLRGFGKPIILAEVAANRYGGYQPAWISGMLSALESRFPEVAAVVYFDTPVDRIHPGIDWSLEPAAIRVLARALKGEPGPALRSELP